MSAPKHTPGPWSFPSWSSVVGSGVFAQPDKGENTKMLAQVRSSVADARLMAAAPDLLAAAESALEDLQEFSGDADYWARVATLRAAIAKARGE